jgi:hypothetical protein
VNDRKSEQIIVKKKESEREKKPLTRKRAFPFDDVAKKNRPASFFLSRSLFLSCTSCKMTEQS